MFYIIIGIIILLLSIYYDFNEGEKKNKKFWLNTLLITLILIPALRYRVGGDTLSYISEYDYMPSLTNYNTNKNFVESRLQPLWILFVAILKSITPSFILFQITHAIIVNTIIFHVLKKYCNFIFMAIFLYYIYAYFKFNFEVLREALAICMIALSIDSCIKKKWCKYYIYVIIAFLFHDSAIIMFFIPFLYGRKINILNSLIIVGISIIIFFNSNIFFERIFSSGILSDKFLLRSYTYIESNEGFTIKGVIYYLSIHLIFPLFIYFIGRNNGIRTVVDNFLLSYIFIGLVASLIPGLYRFANYQIIFSIIYLSTFFEQIRIHNPQNRIAPIHRLFIVCVLSIVLTYRVILIQFRDTSNYYPGTRYYNLYYPYYTIFNPVKYYPRERMVYNMWNYKN